MVAPRHARQPSHRQACVERYGQLLQHRLGALEHALDVGRARRYEPAVSSPDLEALLRAPDSPDTAARVQAWASANPLILFDIAGAIAEVQRAAKRGFRGLSLPCKPVWGPPDHEAINYNLPLFDPLWAAICDVDLPITFHVSTGRDPRTARGNGGAIINYAVHSLSPTMEPLVNLCASGVVERFEMPLIGALNFVMHDALAGG